MRTISLGASVFVLMVSVIVPCGRAFAQPTIPKTKISADLPAGLRETILKLYSPSPLERGKAIRVLAPNRDADPKGRLAIPFLAAMLSDNADSRLKRYYRRSLVFPVGDAAAEALAWFGRPSVKPLIQAFEDGKADVRLRAARALGRIRDPRAAEPLIRALGDKNGDIRAEVLGVLGAILGPKSVKYMLAALGDNYVPKRWKRGNWSISKMAAYRLVSIGKPAVVGLIGSLKSKDPKVRALAAEALGRIRDTSAAEPLILLLKDSRVEVRRKAGEALVLISSRKTLDAALAALQDKDPQVRGYAATILAGHIPGNCKDEKFLDPLILALGDSSVVVRASACRALRRIKNARAIKPLMQVLTDGDPTVRKNAASALGRLRARSAVELLLEMLDDEDKDVRRDAICALGEIGDSRAVAPAKKMFATDKWDGARKAALYTMVKLATPKAAVGLLVTALNDPRVWDSRVVGNALVGIGKPVVEPLIDLLSNTNKDVRQAASNALAQITGRDFAQNAEKWRKWQETQSTDKSK